MSEIRHDAAEASDYVTVMYEAGRRVLTEVESKRLLALIGLPVGASRVCTDLQASRSEAIRLGLPVAMKVVSPEIVHKDAHGCVALNVSDLEAVETTFLDLVSRAESAFPDAKIHGVVIEPMHPPGLEVIVGYERNPIFGPVLMVGVGGTLVEVIDDVCFGVLPLRRYDMIEMIRGTSLGNLFDAASESISYPAEPLIDILKCLSFMRNIPHVSTVDLNPVSLYRSPAQQHAVVIDASITLEQ